MTMTSTLPGRNRSIRNVTLGGLLVNMGLAAFKFAAGVIGHSQAILADAVHTVSDFATDIAVLVGLRYWSKPEDAEHPYGHGRVEQLVSVILAAVLALTGVGIAYHAVTSLQEKHAQAPGGIALWAALVSIVCKEALYRWTAGVGRREKSSAVLANAWHHRSDALSSLPAFVSVALARYVPAWGFMDHVGAVVVAFFILQASVKIAFPSIGQLVDTAPPEPLRGALLAAVRSVEGVDVAHRLRTRYIGADIAVDLHIEVRPTLTVEEGHAIANQVSRVLRERFAEVVDVVVHVEPWGEHARKEGFGGPLHKKA
ncbi:MAG: cation diffusion facilitator family transporter [Planctomycetota bacterium]